MSKPAINILSELPSLKNQMTTEAYVPNQIQIDSLKKPIFTPKSVGVQENPQSESTKHPKTVEKISLCDILKRDHMSDRANNIVFESSHITESTEEDVSKTARKDCSTEQDTMIGQPKPRYQRIRVKKMNYLQRPATAVFFKDVTE